MSDINNGGEEFKPLNDSDVEDYPEEDSEDTTDDEEETENSEESDEDEDGATETKTESEEMETEMKPVKEVIAEKTYFFNGRSLTADQLFQESSLLNAEFTKKSQKLAQLEKEPPQEDPLDEFDQEEKDRFAKLAKGMGFVKKDELIKEQAENTQKDILSGFIAKHPEYNDPATSAKLFETLKGYNTNLNYLSKSLNKAHEELNPPKADDTQSKSKVAAEKVNRQSVGINSGVKPKGSSENLTPQQIAVMQKMGVYEE